MMRAALLVLIKLLQASNDRTNAETCVFVDAGNHKIPKKGPPVKFQVEISPDNKSRLIVGKQITTTASKSYPSAEILQSSTLQGQRVPPLDCLHVGTNKIPRKCHNTIARLKATSDDVWGHSAFWHFCCDLRQCPETVLGSNACETIFSILFNKSQIK